MPSAGGVLQTAEDYQLTGTWSFQTGFVNAVETATTGAPMTTSGLSLVTKSSTAGSISYTIRGPVTGRQKSIVPISGSSSGSTIIVTSLSGTFDGTNQIATFSSGGYLNLYGVSTSKWAVVGISATVALSTS